MSPSGDATGDPAHGPGTHATPGPADVAAWTPQQRDEVARLLAEAADTTMPAMRRTPRLWVLLIGGGGALVLLPWIAYLTATLPVTASGGRWRLAWVGYDILLVVVLAGVAWLALLRRQLVVVALPVAGTLLAVDAWFDVTLSWGTPGQAVALVTAALLEVPVAVFLMVVTLALVRRMVATAAALRGNRTGRFSLWRAPVLTLGSPARDAPRS